MWVYYNLFQPVLHLVEKTAVGTRVRRKWDEAKTPFERLSATEAISPDQRTEIESLRDRTNPRALRKAIYAALEHLLRAAPTAAVEGTAA